MALGTSEEQWLWGEGRGAGARRGGARTKPEPCSRSRNECPLGRMASQSTRRSFLFNPLQEDRRLAKCGLPRAEQ